LFVFKERIQKQTQILFRSFISIMHNKRNKCVYVIKLIIVFVPLEVYISVFAHVWQKVSKSNSCK
jgi:hypothetical protein